MAMTLLQLGNGSGFVYVTQADGTTIITNIENNIDAWQRVQKYASAPLTDPTLEIDGTFGFRIFGNTVGIEGSLAGASELTRFLVNRASQTAAYKKSITISGGVIGGGGTLPRVTNNMMLVVATEGGIADNLDTITVTDVVDNDTITIVGVSSGVGDIVTVKHGTGNIFLSNNADFTTAGRQVEITLKYFTAATTGWYEVSRSNAQPTVANQRAVSVAIPIQGINSSVLPTNGTVTFTVAVDKGYQIITGAPALIAPVAIVQGGTPIDGDEFRVDYRATPTGVGANTVTIFGILLTTQQASEGNVIVTTKYRSTGATWFSTINYANQRTTRTFANAAARTAAATGTPDFDGQIGVQLDTNIAYHANGTTSADWIPIDPLPASGGDTFVLQKTIAGVYSFVPQTATGVMVTFADAAARAAAVPAFDGQLGTQLDTNAVYEATGLAAGNWEQVNMFKLGAGADSIMSKNATSGAGGESIAIGKSSIGSGGGSIAIGSNTASSNNQSIAIGFGANATNANDISIGNAASASGQDSLAVGRNSVASAANTTAIGNAAVSRILKTTNIAGGIITRKDNAEGYSATDKFGFYAGTIVTLTTEEIDLKVIADTTITIPTGCRFYPDSVDVILTTLGGTVTAQPFVRAGISGTPAKLLAIVQTTALTATLFNRERFNTLLSNAGEATLSGGVTTGATGSSTIMGRFVFKGLLIENE